MSTLTLEQMYQDLLKRGFLQGSRRKSRDEKSEIWPWAVNSSHTTLIHADANHKNNGSADADME